MWQNFILRTDYAKYVVLKYSDKLVANNMAWR